MNNDGHGFHELVGESRQGLWLRKHSALFPISVYRCSSVVEMSSFFPSPRRKMITAVMARDADR